MRLMPCVDVKAWVGMRDWVKGNNSGIFLRYSYDLAWVEWHYWFLVYVPKKHD